MPVRASMNALIAKTSLLVGDSANATFTTQQVQDVLDRTRQWVRYELLTAAPDIVPQAAPAPAQFNWATYVSHFQDWEADEVVQAGIHAGQNWAVLTPVSSDELTGMWTFDVVLPAISTSIPAQLPPVFLTGKYYDPNLACAYLHEMWASLLANAYDFTSDGQTFHRSQQAQAHIMLARQFRLNAKPTVLHVQRYDMRRLTALEPVRLLGESNDFGR